MVLEPFGPFYDRFHMEPGWSVPFRMAPGKGPIDLKLKEKQKIPKPKDLNPP